MSLQELESQLADARQRIAEIGKRISLKDQNWRREYESANESALNLEREIAEIKGEEYAVPIGFPVNWDTGAPLPYLLRNEHKAFLTFYLYDPDPNWDGTYVNVLDPGDGSEASLALVEFLHCISAKLGSPNDEVLGGHPLDGRGLDAYTAQKVVNSRWIKEIEQINSVHAFYTPEAWRDLNHYVFWFHDTTFECIAESYKVELFRGSMKELLAVVCERLVV